MTKSDISGSTRFALGLLLVFSVIWTVAAIAPPDRSGWALENVLSCAGLILLLVTHRRFPLSRISYAAIFVFYCLHTIGAHYTYAQVPYDAWFESLFGQTLNSLLGWQRNHFDRLVHFCYGLLFAYPVREVFLRIADVRGFWGYFLPFDVTISTSTIFEEIEWVVVQIFAGDLGMAYLGTQGDVWDAHKDIGLASIGALISMLIVLGINSLLQRDFAREWGESLSVKRSEPLGEVEIDRMLNEDETST